jgi:hypothetical protein
MLTLSLQCFVTSRLSPEGSGYGAAVNRGIADLDPCGLQFDWLISCDPDAKSHRTLLLRKERWVAG